MQDKQRKIIQNYISSYNGFDVEGMTKDFHSEVVFENISEGKVDLTTNGIEEFRQQAEAAKSYFTERKQEIQGWQFDENTVTIDIGYKAILAIDLPNGMKTGDTLEMKGKSVFKFEGEQIVKLQDKS